jgi:hypothetical protein
MVFKALCDISTCFNHVELQHYHSKERFTDYLRAYKCGMIIEKYLNVPIIDYLQKVEVDGRTFTPKNKRGHTND